MVGPQRRAVVCAVQRGLPARLPAPVWLGDGLGTVGRMGQLLGLGAPAEAGGSCRCLEFQSGCALASDTAGSGLGWAQEVAAGHFLGRGSRPAGPHNARSAPSAFELVGACRSVLLAGVPFPLPALLCATSLCASCSRAIVVGRGTLLYLVPTGSYPGASSSTGPGRALQSTSSGISLSRSPASGNASFTGAAAVVAAGAEAGAAAAAGSSSSLSPSLEPS